MIITLKLTEDHLKLIRMLDINDDSDNEIKIDRKVMLTQQTHLLDDVATVLGMRDKVISGTEDDADGGAYPDDVENYLKEVYDYVSDNLYYIETLIHQRVCEGVQEGTYKASDTDLIWRKV